jgi:hypothetical protein
MNTPREKITKTLVAVVTKELPMGVTEAERQDKLATICLMTNIMNGEEEWQSIWRDVMAKTGCGTWNETMNKGKH